MNINNFSKFFKLGNYYRVARFGINRHILHRLEPFFAPKSSDSFKSPPVFVLGAPRSGSTFLFQVISDSFDIGFLTNKQCKWFGFPSLANPPKKAPRKQAMGPYESNDGVIDGKHAPSECGEWWYRFFRREPAFVTINDVPCRQMKRFRRSLLMLQKSSGKPFVFKNLYASLRIGPIKACIPEALFIVIYRDEVDNAISILNGRYRNVGSYDDWWSVPPPNVEELMQLPPHEQSINQVREINQTIIDGLASANVSESDIVFIKYEDLCGDVGSCMTQVEHMLRNKGWDGTRNNLVRNTFETRHQHLADANLEEKLRSYSAKTQPNQRGVYVK